MTNIITQALNKTGEFEGRNIGFKATNHDMTCTPFNINNFNIKGFEQYAIGETNRVEGDLIPCKNGIHFCSDIINVFIFYKFTNSNYRLFIIEYGENHKHLDNKSITNEITFLYEITDDVLLEYLNHFKLITFKYKNTVSRCVRLTEDFIIENIDDLDFYTIIRYQNISEKFIIDHLPKIMYDELSLNEYLITNINGSTILKRISKYFDINTGLMNHRGYVKYIWERFKNKLINLYDKIYKV